MLDYVLTRLVPVAFRVPWLSGGALSSFISSPFSHTPPLSIDIYTVQLEGQINDLLHMWVLYRTWGRIRSHGAWLLLLLPPSLQHETGLYLPTIEMSSSDRTGHTFPGCKAQKDCWFAMANARNLLPA